MNPLRLAWLWLGLGMGMLIVIMVFALLPISDISSPRISDKLLHGLAFAFLMTWFGGVFASRSWIWVGLGLLAYGGVMEILQNLTAHREFEWLDMLADLLGLAAGVLLLKLAASRWCEQLEAMLLRSPGP